MSKVILVVDDSASVRQVVGIALKGAGYSIVEASDGQDALNKLNGQTINLVISDLNMPVMDGITLVKEMKGSFNAFLLQSAARIFGHNLKEEYEREEQRDIEQILQQAGYDSYKN